MSLEKGIEHGKEHRKPYYRSQRFDRTCRPHGSCPYCYGNRFHTIRKKEILAEEDLKTWYDDWNMELLDQVLYEGGYDI